MAGTTLHIGDCLDVLKTLPEASIHACVTDPPYHLTSIVKRFGAAGAAPAQFGTDGAYARASRGFMGKQWDGGDVAFRPETWAAIGLVLKPGAHVLAFGGTRTFHRMAVAIEDAGLELRDTLMWLYGTGFPKSHNQRGEWEGWGTALKPAWEPIILARKPLDGTVADNLRRHGVGALNIDGCRVDGSGGGTHCTNRDVAGKCLGHPNRSGTAFGLTYHGPEGEADQGRWPANVVHDGSDEVVAAFPESAGQQGDLRETGRPRPTKHAFGDMAPPKAHAARNDSGSAARFFYAAKASKADRAGSKHPTVKPVSLMRYLVRLITPPGGVVLDPFAGSGTTGQAAREEGFSSVLIERELEYAADIDRRLGLGAMGVFA